ncbi:MAG: YggT family protein [Firmicutes bacterium]|nr:YggT family protein [Bacillota bacterium]
MSIISEVLVTFINILDYAILIRCIMSWFPISRDNPFYKLMYSITEPILGPVRNMVARSPIGGSMRMLDFSPIIAMLLLSGIEQVVISMLH